MRLATAISRLADRLNGSVPDPILHFELVRALYGATSTAKPLFIATAAATGVTAVAALLSSDLVFASIAVLFLLTGIARSVAASLYHRVEHDPFDNADLRRWEMIALFGAWSFSGLVGVAGAYAVSYHPGTDVEILISCCVIGYVAGVSSRNASRPLVTIGQVSFTCLPFTVALLLRGDVAHLVLAIFIGALYVGTIVICRSVFENLVSRHQAFRRIETLAQRDVLTGLWNRAAFLSLLEAKFASPARDEVALIAIDLDRFKDINDTLGHPIGDAVLKEAAERIRSALRPGDEVSRVGGDEFLVMLAGPRAKDMGAVSRSILAKFSDPFAIEMTRSICGASIGCAIAGRECTMDALLRNADLALYEAKRRGRSQVVEYTVELSLEYESRVALEHDLQRALGRGELDIVYQPIVDPRSGRAICCEALLRWNHPELGSIAPDVFIPIAETTGLIVPIGSWVLTKACTEATHWSADIKLSVNLSAVQFRHGREIVRRVKAALAESGLPPSRLDLEITESVLFEDNAATLGILEELRSMKIGISLDDFGTGFASLGYLNDFPFSKIKIDRKFSQKVSESSRTSAIVAGTAQIARDLRMECIAEGVESEVQLERLRSYGINAIQGYLFSKPLPAHKLRKLIQQPIFPASYKVAARATDKVATRRKLAL